MKTDQRIYTLKRGTSEWDRAWAGCCPDGKFDEGEGWQYMGTVQLESGAYAHQFRNRCINGQREYRNVSAVQFPKICEEVYEPVIVYTAVCTKLEDGRIDANLWQHMTGSSWRDGEQIEGATLATEAETLANVARRARIEVSAIIVHRVNYKRGEDDGVDMRGAAANTKHPFPFEAYGPKAWGFGRALHESDIGGVVDCMGNVSSDADSGL